MSKFILMTLTVLVMFATVIVINDIYPPLWWAP